MADPRFRLPSALALQHYKTVLDGKLGARTLKHALQRPADILTVCQRDHHLMQGRDQRAFLGELALFFRNVHEYPPAARSTDSYFLIITGRIIVGQQKSPAQDNWTGLCRTINGLVLC